MNIAPGQFFRLGLNPRPVGAPAERLMEAGSSSSSPAGDEHSSIFACRLFLAVTFGWWWAAWWEQRTSLSCRKLNEPLHQRVKPLNSD